MIATMVETRDDLGLGPSEKLEMVVDGRHAEDAFALPVFSFCVLKYAF